MESPRSALQQSQTSPQQTAQILHHQKYLPDQIPPDWALAAAHAQAVRPGRPRPGSIEACPCCFAYIDKQPLGYNQNVKQLGFLGQGFPLFCNFMKYCIVMLLVLLIDDGIVGIVLSNSQNQCNQALHSPRLLAQTTTPTTPHQMTNCDNNYANINAYITDTESTTRRAIKFTSFIAQLLLLIYFRDQQNKLASYIDQRTTTMSDYSLRLSNIPQGQTDNKERLTRILKECDGDCQIMDVLLIEDITEYKEQERVLKGIVEEQKKAHKKGDQVAIVELHRKYVRQKKRIDKIGKAMKNNEKQFFIGEAFIVMNTEEQKERIIQMINQIDQEKVKEHYPGYNPSTNGKITAVQAPQPKQIIWQNIHYSKKSRIGGILLGWLLAILTIVAITIAFFFLIKFKGHLIQQAHLHYTQNPTLYEQQYRQGVALGYIIVILINLFNKFIISYVTHHLTDIERHQSQWSYNFSYALKYTLSMFFTTALMTLMVEAMIYVNYTGSLGVIEEETFMFIFNAYFGPIVWLINPYNMVAWIRRKIMYGNQNITQAQANHIMELPSYNMGKRYAEVIKTVWFTFLYVQIIPIGTVYSLTGMILYYLVDKYVMLYRCSIKDSISSGLSRTMITVLDFTLVLKPAGQMLFDSQLRHTFSIDSLVMLCVGFVYMLLPVNRILELVNHQNFNPQAKTYESVKNMFAETYFTLYPIERNELTVKYLGREVVELRLQSPGKGKSGGGAVVPSEKNIMTEENQQNRLPKLYQNGNRVHSLQNGQYELSAIGLHPQKKMSGEGPTHLPPIPREV